MGREWPQKSLPGTCSATWPNCQKKTQKAQHFILVREQQKKKIRFANNSSLAGTGADLELAVFCPWRLPASCRCTEKRHRKQWQGEQDCPQRPEWQDDEGGYLQLVFLPPQRKRVLPGMGLSLRGHGHCADWCLFHLLSGNMMTCSQGRVWPLKSCCGKGLSVDQRLAACVGADKERKISEVRI